MNFKDYIEQNYLYDMTDHFRFLLDDDLFQFGFSTSYLDYIDEVEIIDEEIKFIQIEDSYKDSFNFTVAVAYNLDLVGENKGDIQHERTIKWISFYCSIDINEKGLSNFNIDCIHSYDQREYMERLASDKLVPFIKAEDLDDVATEILEKYYPEALSNVQSIDTDVLLKRIGLEKRYAKLADQSISGQLFFKKSIKKSPRTNKDIVINKGTIVINSNYELFEVAGTENLTMAHEVVHWVKHRKSMWFDNAVNGSKTKCLSCKIDGTAIGDDLLFVDWMEWQANSIAPRILMPKKQFITKTNQLLDAYMLSYESSDYLYFIEQVIEDLAQFYCVPKNSVKIRLIDCGFQIALGAGIYLDGRHIIAHSFKKDFLKSRETFTIEQVDAMMLFFVEHLKQNVSILNYRLVENHLVYLSDKYLLKDSNGNYYLTDYARHHMDECSLVFEYGTNEISKYKNNYNYIQDCILY